MKNMRIPFRSAPTIGEPRKKNAVNQKNCHNSKKKPPPRPPPPKFSKTNIPQWNLNEGPEEVSLIDFNAEPINNQIVARKTNFAGSESSSFNSSTNSLASSKNSFESEAEHLDPWELQDGLLPSNTNSSQSKFYVTSFNQQMTSNLSVPTIIRAQSNKHKVVKTIYECSEREDSPPMPSVPPPSPPKDIAEVVVPYGIALYDFPSTHETDLSLQINDIVILIRRVNAEWMYGRVGDREGMFPTNFISIQVPLSEDCYATAIYEFRPQLTGDLALKPGQRILVTGRISTEWLTGECDGQVGQFPANFIDKVPFNM